MHMLSWNDLNLAELETVRISRTDTTVITANGEVQTKEEATENVHGLELFVTVQILEDTLAVLSPGKLCEEHGYCCWRTSGQKPQLTHNGKRILCNTENFAPIVVPGLSTGSSTSRESTSSTSLLQGTSDNSSSRPATTRHQSKIGTRSSIGKPVARLATVVTGVRRKSGRRRSVRIKGHGQTPLKIQIRKVLLNASRSQSSQ